MGQARLTPVETIPSFDAVDAFSHLAPSHLVSREMLGLYYLIAHHLVEALVYLQGLV